MTLSKGVLAVALALSLGINALLYWQLQVQVTAPRQVSNSQPLRQMPAAPGISQTSKAERKQVLAPTSNNAQQQTQIRLWLAAEEFQLAREAIQQHLRQHPNDITYLLLEAELVRHTAPVNDVLAQHYALLDYPLDSSQKAQLLATIEALTSANIAQLKALRAWDILASFVEPLWQFDPTNKAVITALAESYAWRGQEFLMENVLASLPQGDLGALRIRQILAKQTQPEAVAETTPAQPDRYERSLPLTAMGDHFIAPVMINRQDLTLMLDTGASTTVLSQASFARLTARQPVSYVGTYQVNTAGGTVMAPVYRLPHIFLGGFRVDEVAVVVLPLQDFTVANGLLGMNVLRQFDFKIDQQQQRLLLNRNPLNKEN